MFQGAHVQQPEYNFNGWDALRTINNFVGDRDNAGVPMSEADWHKLDIVKRDTVQRIIQQRDGDIFRDLDAQKHVELEYLYQVRGLRQVIPSAIFGDGYSGYGNSWTGNKIRLLYPQDRKRAGRLSRELLLSKPHVDLTVDLPEQIVPLRVTLDSERYRLRERFLWNAEDPTVPLEIFVENMLEDYGLPLSLQGQITTSLQDQLSRHAPSIAPPEPACEPHTGSTVSDRRSEFTPEMLAEKLASKELQELPDEDLRITVCLDITIGLHTLQDKFEWDVTCEDNSPEEFAVCLTNELCLPPEFGPAISHAIREQSQVFVRALCSAGVRFESKVIADRAIIPHLSAPVYAQSFLRRPELLDKFAPELRPVSLSDMEAHRADQDRESRSRRRAGRSRRGFDRHGGSAPAGPNGAGAGTASVTVIDPLDALDPLEALRSMHSIKDMATPLYSSVLPAGLDRNLDIVRTFAHNFDDGETWTSVLDYVTRLRQQRRIPSVSEFSQQLVDRYRDRLVVKLKLPRSLPPKLGEALARMETD